MGFKHLMIQKIVCWISKHVTPSTTFGDEEVDENMPL